MRIVIATNNRKKRGEIEAILSDFSLPVLCYSEVCEPFEIEETGATFEENAEIKANAVAKKLPEDIVIADDSGLMIDALDGAPGVYSARFAGEDATDAQKVEKVLGLMKGLPKSERRARFVSCVFCRMPDGRSFCEKGVCEGHITDEPKGEGGFGYDPVFVCDDLPGRTFAELSRSEKASVSHRGRALEKFRQTFSKEMQRK